MRYESKIKLQGFTQVDWDLFAGAEPTTDGKQPLIAYAAIGETEPRRIVHGAFTADANGAQVTWDGGTEENPVQNCWILGCTFEAARVILQSLVLNVSVEEFEKALGALGFENVFDKGGAR